MSIHTGNRKASLKLGDTQSKCARCGKTVYFAEQVFGAGHKWHKQCFKCAECNKSISSSNMRDKDGELYCTSCHGRLFGTKGYGFGIGSGVLSTDTGTAGEVVSTAPKMAPAGTGGCGSGKGCPRCNCVVYDAEKVQAVGKAFHKLCFKCSTCEKLLNATTFREHNEEIFCRACYEKDFAPKGFGFGQALSRT